MSRYIDADALIESICHTADLGGWIGDTLRNIKRLAVRYINETPSIDIVRCKECKHSPWNYSDEGPLDYTCIWDDDFADRPQRPDDFCSYGERKEGE